jgi:hypothetical protein
LSAWIHTISIWIAALMSAVCVTETEANVAQTTTAASVRAVMEQLASKNKFEILATVPHQAEAAVQPDEEAAGLGICPPIRNMDFKC